MSRHARVRDTLLGIALAFVCSWARADEARRALVLAPETRDAALIEVSSRVLGELTAAGFEVVTAAAPAHVSPQAAVETAARSPDSAASAVLLIAPGRGHPADAPSIEIWLSDRLLGRTSVARLDGATRASDATPNRLAVQAAELLRARLSERDIAPQDEEPPGWLQAPAEPRVDASTPAPAEPENLRSQERGAPQFGLGVGLGWLNAGSSLEAALMPVVSASLSLGEPGPSQAPLAVDLRLVAAGFGQDTQLRAEQGSARVDRAFGSLGAALRLVPRVPIEPFVSVAAGVRAVNVRGRAELPYLGHAAKQWSPLGSVGLGLRTRPLWHLSVLVQAELLAATSAASVRIAGSEVARTDVTSWFLRAELAGVF